MQMITKQQLLDMGVYDSKGRISSLFIKTASDSVKQQIINATSFLENDPKLSIRIRCIMQGVTNHPSCIHCQKPTAYNPRSTADAIFSDYCSRQCSYDHPARMIKARKTNIARYGSEYHQLSTDGKQQRQQTNISKYGHISPASNPTVREKIASTNVERYGHVNVFGSEHGKAAIAATNKERYGSASYQTSTLSDDAIQLLNDKSWLSEANKAGNNLQQIADMLGCSPTCVHQHFGKHGLTVQRQQISSFEREVHAYIQSLGLSTTPTFKLGDTEFDMLVDGTNVIVECDGIYWHGEHLTGRSSKYHKNKTTVATSNGYQLIHIFENEWMCQQSIVKSMLKSKLHKTDVRCGARQCSVIELTAKEANTFLHNNHIQGKCKSPIHYGLTHNDVLVAVVSLSKDRYSHKENCLELVRFCTKQNTNVAGALSKLIAHVRRTYPTHDIVTFADARYSQGAGYIACGFEFVEMTSPAYHYFKTNNCLTLLNRQHFQKHRLHSILPNFDPELTEWENMIDNGYDRIWDCGNYKFILPAST